MSNAPRYEIDLADFWNDPYPALKEMRERAPLVYVPQLGATLITRRDDIFENEKKIDIFSSVQPDGLMVKLMGQNMMRKDGADHRSERKAIFPVVSPVTVKSVWKQAFVAMVSDILDDISPLGKADMVHDIAKRISGEALRIITGLTNMSWQEMDRVSQGMIDGIANYAGDMIIEKRCLECTSAIEDYIDVMIPEKHKQPDTSPLSVALAAGFSQEQLYANIKLAISGGQNEVRDVIAGLIWALLTHPAQMRRIQDGTNNYVDAFEEFCRWISPVGMSPRRIAQS